MLKKAFPNASFFFSHYEDLKDAWRNYRLIKERGLTVPLPRFLKVGVLKREAINMGAEILVETGTYLGDTVFELRDQFSEIYTVEVEAGLHEAARKRFAKYAHIHTVFGDSSQVLPEILKKIDPKRKILFWLDGHYSGAGTGKGRKETPIVEEISTIAARSLDNVEILIDDARCFGTDPAYPSLAEFRQLAEKLFPSHAIEVENDMIAIRPV